VSHGIPCRGRVLFREGYDTVMDGLQYRMGYRAGWATIPEEGGACGKDGGMPEQDAVQTFSATLFPA
jgi:hypothetical protein